jgi:hypothetical protein
MKKGIMVLSSLVLLVLPLLLQACQPASGNNFDVLALGITPGKVIVNEKFTVTANISNAGRSESSYIVPVMVNGIADDRTTITLAPGKSQEVQFTLRRSEPGIYEIRIGNQNASITVEKSAPAEFKLSDLKVNMEEANPGEEVVIVATVSNNGGSEGTYVAELKVNGVANQSEKVSFPAGAKYNFVFKLTKDEPGIYNIAVGDLTGKYTVLEPVKVIQVTEPSDTPSDTGWKLKSHRQPCCGGGSCP